MNKKSLAMASLMLTASLGSVAVTAGQKIDIIKYDIVNIYKNVNEETMDRLLKDDIFSFGDSPYKVEKKVDFSCESLGYSSSDPGYVENKYPDHSYRHYEKKQNEDLTTTCDESVYKKSSYNTYGAKSMAVLIDGND